MSNNEDIYRTAKVFIELVTYDEASEMIPSILHEMNTRDLHLTLLSAVALVNFLRKRCANKDIFNEEITNWGLFLSQREVGLDENS